MNYRIIDLNCKRKWFIQNVYILTGRYISLNLAVFNTVIDNLIWLLINKLFILVDYMISLLWTFMCVFFFIFYLYFLVCNQQSDSNFVVFCLFFLSLPQETVKIKSRLYSVRAFRFYYSQRPLTCLTFKYFCYERTWWM